MAGTDEQFSEKFDELLDELIPEQSEEELIDPSTPDTSESERTQFLRRLRESITLGVNVDDDRQIEIAERVIENACEELDTPQTTEEMAKQMFTQFATSREREGDVFYAIEFYAIAAVYSAARMTEAGVIPERVVDAGPSILTEKLLFRRTKTMTNELNLDPSVFFDATQYVDPYCKELGLGEEIQDRAEAIIQVCEDQGISSGKSPTGWAAAAVYNAVREFGRDITQSEIAEVAGVTELTIRNRYQDQRTVLTNIEAETETSEDVVRWLCNRLGLDEDLESTAVRSLRRANDTVEGSISRDISPPDSGEPIEWGAGSVWLELSDRDTELSPRVLKTLTDIPVGEIKRRARLLRKV